MSEASGSASPAPPASVEDASAPGARPKRAVRPTAKALLAREQSPEGWEHGGSKKPQPSRPVRTPSGARPQIKLKMKASGGGTAAGVGQGPKTQPYMQGYDRELDSEDDETGEGLAFEEQLIFRMPEGPECDRLREAIQKRQLGDDVWFKFKDSRRAVVHVGDSLFSAKLVDLPTITESHKTLDNRQFFKVGDIAQMLVVEGKIADESQASSSSGGGKGFNIDDFIYPHGITPPMHWARKRRFRRRAARRAIETVEKEVERLLRADKKAEQVEYEMVDAADDGGSEEDEIDRHGGQSRRGPMSPGGSQADTPMPDGSDGGSQDEDGEPANEDAEGGEQASRRHEMDRDQGEGGYVDEDLDDDVDEDLAAELDAALEEEEDDEDDVDSTRGAGSEAQSRASDQEDLWDDEEDDDADDGGDDDDDEEDENDEEKEQRVREAQLEAECRELETLVRRKQADVDGTMNLIIKNRHQQALRKLTTERDMKRNQLAELKQTRKDRKEANLAAKQVPGATAAVDSGQDTAQHEDGASHDPVRQQQSAASTEHAFSSSDVADVLGEHSHASAQNRDMPPPALPASRNRTAARATSFSDEHDLDGHAAQGVNELGHDEDG